MLSKFVSVSAPLKGGHEAAFSKNLLDALHPGVAMKLLDPRQILGNPAVANPAQDIFWTTGSGVQFFKDGGNKLAICLGKCGSCFLGQSVEYTRAAFPRPHPSTPDQALGLKHREMVPNRAPRQVQSPSERSDSLVAVHSKCFEDRSPRAVDDTALHRTPAALRCGPLLPGVR